MILTYEDLRENLIKNSKKFGELKRDGGVTKPIGISIALTGRCNSHCIQCSIWKLCARDIYNKEMIKNEMSIEEIIGYLNDPIMSDIVEIDLTGGEPYLRSDIDEIVLNIIELKKKSILKKLKTIIIPTNGFLTNTIVAKVKNILTYIKDTDIDFVTVCSLDGIGATHDFMRGTEKAYKMVNETIEALRDLQSKHHGYFFIGIKMTITHDNVDELDKMLEYAKERDLFFIISSVIIALKRFRNTKWKDKLMLNEDDYKKIKKFYQNKSMEFDFYYKKVFNSMITGIKQWTCTALYNYLFIDYDRKVYPCPIQDVCAGDLSQNSLSEILNSKKAADIRKNVGTYPICRQCTEPGTVRYSQVLEGKDFLEFIELNGAENIQKLIFDKGLHKLL